MTKKNVFCFQIHRIIDSHIYMTMWVAYRTILYRLSRTAYSRSCYDHCIYSLVPVYYPAASCLLHTHTYTDYPSAPSDLNITRPADTNSIGMSWIAGSVSNHGFVLTPLDGYVVQTRINRKTLYFSDMMELGAGATEADVAGLFPGTEYDIRVVSINQAGRTPSDSITFTTIADGEKETHY